MQTRVLIIEDEITIRQNIAEFLSLQGYEVFATDDGFAGIEIAQQQRPDLILCDVNMPVMDGYNVLAALQQNPALASIPFIFITALAEHSDRRLGMELGADDYLVKPFTFDELMQAMKTRLHKRTAAATYYREELQDAFGLAKDMTDNANSA